MSWEQVLCLDEDLVEGWPVTLLRTAQSGRRQAAGLERQYAR